MEKQKENQRRKHNAGITLIALIITIIILLILAMVTIRILMNQGIIRHAENATDAYNNAQNNETEYLSYVEGEMDKYAGGNSNGANADLDLLQRYCLGDNKEGLDLLDKVLDADTMTFKDREPIPNASTALVYDSMDFAEEGGSYLVNIYFNYNGEKYKLITLMDGETGTYTTQSVEIFIELSLDKKTIFLGIDAEHNETEIQSLTASMSGEEITSAIEWSTSNDGIVSLEQTAKTSINVTAIGEGTTTITATYKGYTAICEVTVESKLRYGDMWLKVGDYVAYNATKDAGGNAVAIISYTSYAEENASSNKNNGRTSGYINDQTYNVNNYTDGWRVLGIKNGQIQLISASSVGTLYLQGQKGYLHSVEELNAISAIYGQGKGAAGARSINVDDVNEKTGYNPAQNVNQYGNKYTYYWKGDEYPYYVDSNGNTGSLNIGHNNFYWFDAGRVYSSPKSTTATNTNGGRERITTINHTWYNYYPYSLTTSSSTSGELKGISKNSNEYKVLFGQSYYLASRCTWCTSDYVDFYIRMVESTQVSYGAHLFTSYSGPSSTFNNSNGIRPVVTLSADVQIKSDGTQDGSSQAKAYTIE